MTPTVVYIELLACPLAFLGSYLGNASVVNFAIGMICQLHFGISFSIRNSFLLSYIACTAWCVFLPVGWEAVQKPTKKKKMSMNALLNTTITFLLVGGMVGSNVWFETIGKDCSTGSLRQIWSTLLQVSQSNQDFAFHDYLSQVLRLLTMFHLDYFRIVGMCSSVLRSKQDILSVLIS
jgi:hypothetical protein